MSDSDIIIETSSNQFEFLISDGDCITINYKAYPNTNFHSVTMSKGIFIKMIQEFTNKPNYILAYGTFVNPNFDEKHDLNHL